MNFALIVAGGVGARAQQSIPKQFICVNDKPIIVYTMESFQWHEEIDAIGLVCLDGWIEPMWTYAKQFGINKLKWIITGGTTVQESIYKGLLEVENIAKADDIVMIHDGVRPFISHNLISELIDTCKKSGNACTSQPFNEQIFRVDGHPEYTNKFIDRSTIRIVQTPQAYKFSDVMGVYNEAFRLQRGLQNGSYTNTTMVDFGYTLNLVVGPSDNIKITTKSDIELFKVLLTHLDRKRKDG